MKKVAGTLRLDLAQYRELAAFAAFGSDLDEATKRQLNRGERLVELLKQDQYAPADVIDQAIAILIATKGYFDVVPTAKIRNAEKDVLEFFHSRHAEMVTEIKNAREISGANEAKILEAAKTFLATKKY